MLPNKFATKTLPALALLGIGLLTTVLFSMNIKRNIEAKAAREFAYAADQITLKIRDRLETSKLALRGGAGLFAASDIVERKEWRTYIETLRSQKNIPGVQGIGFSQVIPPDQLAAHIARIRAEGFPGYTVWPAGARSLYTSIIYLEPFRDRNLRAFGFDMYSEPVRRAAMEQARDMDIAAMSGKVELVQETGTGVQAGVLMYVPVYRNGMPTDTVGQRRAGLIGWVYSPYRMTDLMSGLLGEWHDQLGKDIDLHIYDGLQAMPATLLFDSLVRFTPNVHSLFYQQRSVDFNGHKWLLEFDRNPASSNLNYQPAWLALAGGLAICGLLYGLMLSLINTRTNAQRIAVELTEEIRTRAQLLKESENRWNFALEGSDLGVWDWNLADDAVFFSKRWKEMLGYSVDEIGASLDEWEKRLHPDDRTEALASVQAYLDGKSPAYLSKYRLRCRDGSYKWIIDRGMVVSRSDDGKPLRMIGTHADITESELLEETLRQSHRELLEAQRIAQMGSWHMELATNHVVWSQELYLMFGLNQASAPPDYTEHSRLFAPESWDRLSAAISRTQNTGTPYELELEMIRMDGAHGWMLARGEAVRDASGAIVALQGVAANITERKQAEINNRQLTRLYAALSECNAAILRCATQEELFKKLCEIVVRFGGMKMAWIGLVDAGTGGVSPVASYGDGTEYLLGIQISINADDPHGQGPTGTAARENRPLWVSNFAQDPRTSPWHERAARFGWGATAALPICREGKPVGALTFYTAETVWADNETRNLLETMAEQISFAVDKFASDAEAEEYQAGLIESEQRFRSLVEQSIAGAFIVQEHKLAYVNPRFEQILGYPSGGGLIGHTLLEIIASKDVEAVNKYLADLHEGKESRINFVITALRQDGTQVEVGINLAQASYQQRPAIIGLMQDISDRKVAEEQIRRYAEQLEHTFMQTVALATTLSEKRDPYTAGHEMRVAEIAVAIGGEMGLDKYQLEGLKVSGYLHDVGKTVVPSEILSRPGKLSSVEYELIKEHAKAGYEVLKEVEFPWPVAQVALQHHERMDGSGYPQGLKGDEIIFEARIIAVADVVESMASHRPYRPAMGIDTALAEIERGRGLIYDPVIADACLHLFREKKFVIPG